MKNNKICFSKSISIIVFIVLVVGIFTFFAFQLSKQPTSTNTRASAPNGNSRPSNSSPIIGGVSAVDGEFPFQVSIFRKDGLLWCGGALIGKEWVLTAGHCLFDSEGTMYDPLTMEIVIGLDHLNKDMYALHYSAIDDYKLHKDYNKWFFTNDIALLHLKTHAAGIPTISIYNPGVGELLEELGVNQQVTVMGFGATSTDPKHPHNSKDLKKIETLTISKKGILDGKTKFNLSSSDGSATWNGDSGNPTCFPYNGIYYVAGIVSLGCKDKCEITTSVSYFYSWINEKTNIIGNSGTYKKTDPIMIKKAIPICTNIPNKKLCEEKIWLCTWESSVDGGNGKCISDPKKR